MSRRNLTSTNSLDNSNPENPFGDHSFGNRSDDLTSQGSSSQPYQTNENSQDSLFNNSKSFGNLENDYKGYYSRNASRADHLAQSSANNSHADLNGPHSAQNLLSSHNNSTTNFLAPNNNNNNTDDRLYMSSQRNSPGMTSMASFQSTSVPANEQDFSPFGGYPANTFPLLLDEKEDDDFLHNPDPEEEARLDRKRYLDDLKYMDRRSAGGLIGVCFLFALAAFIFVILPAVTFTGVIDHPGPAVIDGPLTQYVYPQLAGIRTSLVDPDTPSTAMTRTAKDGSKWDLVFSDEFNANGRTFYDGDDQFWTGPDLHYDATKDLEWYSPDAATTSNGTLQLRLDAYKNHDLYYRSGMLQSWNKMCFTQGALEVSVNLPNYGRVTGLWPGLWTMGNIARPGYLASTEGVWPYSYESCDAGITPNQSSPDGISYLPGQKLNACTCDGEEHPNPGSGRGAPEIDILEGEVDTKLAVGIASQSLQVAPFDIWYIPDYNFIELYNTTISTMNNYCGGPFQQAVSAVSTLNTTWYEFGPEAGYFQKFAIEYLNDNDDGYIRWFVGDNPTLTIHAKALHPNGNISWRRISKEPMSIILNLGISNNWAYIDWQSIYFPVTLSIDYVRLYQPKDAVSVTCDPDDYPTYDYINSHLNAYHNTNLTSWEHAGYTFPKNILTGKCSSSKFSLSSNRTLSQ